MKRKYKEITKDTIVSARINDYEMHNVRKLMDLTNLTASEVMRKAFYLQLERFNETRAMSSSCL